MNRFSIDPAEFLRRLLSPFMSAAQLGVGSQVRLKRQALLLPIIPLGALGKIRRLDAHMAERGRPYEVEFNLNGYGLKQCDFVPEDLLLRWGMDPNEPLTHLWAYLGPDDLEAVP
jgi:hypothetical protein